MLPKLRHFGRIKPKYNPVPNAAEHRHEQRLMRLPCFGCGRFGVELHHTLLKFQAKRWRRDHRFQLPLCAACHRGPDGIHGIGDEETWLQSVGMTAGEAIAWMLHQWAESEKVCG